MLKRGGQFIALNDDLIRITDRVAADFTEKAGPILAPVGSMVQHGITFGVAMAERAFTAAGAVVDSVQKERQRAADEAAAKAGDASGTHTGPSGAGANSSQSPFGAAATEILRGLTGLNSTTQSINSVFGGVNSVLNQVRSVANAAASAATAAASAATQPPPSDASAAGQDPTFYATSTGTASTTASGAAAGGAAGTGSGSSADGGASGSSDAKSDSGASETAYAPFAPLVGLSQGALALARKVKHALFILFPCN